MSSTIDTPTSDDRLDLEHCKEPGYILRFLSYLLDLTLFTIVSAIFALLWSTALGSENAVLSLLLIAAQFLLFAVLGGLFEGSRWHATPGKMLFSMKVIRRDGEFPTTKEALLRNLAKWFGLSLCQLLALSVFFDGFDRGSWDAVANTLVVRTPKA